MVTIHHGWMNYLKYLKPGWAGMAVRLGTVVVVAVAAGSAINDTEHARAEGSMQNCPNPTASGNMNTEANGTWVWKNLCSYGYYSYSPAPSKPPTESDTYSSSRYPYWWDGKWHSMPTPKPSASATPDAGAPMDPGQQNTLAGQSPQQVPSQNQPPSVVTAPRTVCDLPARPAASPLPSSKPTSSQKYDSVRYPFWWDGAWHPMPTPKAVTPAS